MGKEAVQTLIREALFVCEFPDALVDSKPLGFLVLVVEVGGWDDSNDPRGPKKRPK